MKFVLIFVLYPTWSQFGVERHIDFQSMEDCSVALEQMKTDRDGYKVCVPKDQEFWHYKKEDVEHK